MYSWIRTFLMVISCLCLVTSSAIVAATTASAAPTYAETYRPQFHFSPKQNWMNDPNGLVYHRGLWHLYYQHNPEGNTWGNMSWGHATSKDLVDWTEQPLAIKYDDSEAIFSGSIVVDEKNSSGFGKPGKPALVAMYTSDQKPSGIQAQSLAYSVDDGTTWTKYSGNPVLDIGSKNFRDPKMFWYEPTKSWRMVLVLADQHKVSIYSSKDLKSWSHLSDFGPLNAVGGVWECPDLFPLPVDGDKKKTKWVMLVSLNPGGPAGGSGTQYFVGDFDGTTFTPDDSATYTPPAGTVLADFEGPDYAGWTPTGTAFGTAPYPGTVPGQQEVSGYAGAQLVNSFGGGDAPIGTLTSPAFTVNQRYLNFLVGGGAHKHIPGSITEPPSGTVFADFEGPTYGEGWVGTGDYSTTGPAQPNLPGQLGNGVIDTCVGPCDPATGTITSPTFTITSDYINFLLAGGRHPWGEDRPTSVNLVVDGSVAATATGDNSGQMRWVAWDTSALQGKQAQIQIVDQGTGDRGWDHIMIDHFTFSDTAATAWNIETAVNLLIDGEVVDSASGAESERLDWASFDLQQYAGKQAQIQIVDNNTGGWGHILADQFTLSSAPALNTLQRSHWVDHGADNYAGVTFNGAPGGRRVFIGWMNNWLYGQDIPTSPWRSAMTVARDLRLTTSGGKVVLASAPVPALRKLQTGAPQIDVLRTLKSGQQVTLKAKGATLDLTATLAAGSAEDFGLAVRTGNGQQTRIGYDRSTGMLYIDRTASGAVSFNPAFPAVHRAPLKLSHGLLTVRILIDASSVEVFAADGKVVLTDQIFPDPGSVGVQAYANGGTAYLIGSVARKLASIWT